VAAFCFPRLRLFEITRVLVRFDHVATLGNLPRGYVSWLLVEWLVQVSDHDIGMPRNVKEIREDLDRLPIFHLRLWTVCLNLFLRCFDESVRDIINLRRPFWNPDLLHSNHPGVSTCSWL
jgi:hypothetical protein